MIGPARLYVDLWRLRRAHRRAHQGVLASVGIMWAPVAVAVLCVPLAESVFLSFLDRPQEQWGPGISGALMRYGLVMVGALALDLFSALVRGEDRKVLGVLPVDPGGLVPACVLRVAQERLWWVPAGMVLLSPVVFRSGGDPDAIRLWCVCAVVLMGGWLLALSSGSLVHMWSIEVAENPSFARWLDMVRGNNPRAQAAFLYAPGLILGASGLLLGQACFSVSAAIEGSVLAWVCIAAPYLLAALIWRPVPRLARRAWFGGTAVLADIRARYETLLDAEEARRVYLDWGVRWLPAAWRRYALKDLRQGWRARRTWVLVPWGLGVASALAGWTSDPAGVSHAAVFASGSAWCLGVVGAIMVRDDPPFLRVWLPNPGLPGFMARAVVVAAWLQPCVWPAVLVVAIRADLAQAGWVLLTVGISALGAGLLSGVCSNIGRSGVAWYAPMAVCAATLIGMWTMTGGMA